MSIISPPTWTGIMPTTRKRRIQRRLAGPELLDLPFGVGQVHVQRYGIAIHQQGHGALIADHFGGGGEGHRGHEHGLARVQAQRLDGQMQRGGAGIDGHGVPAAHLLGQRGSRTAHRGPVVSQPERRQATTSAISASVIEGRKKGTCSIGLLDIIVGTEGFS